MIFIETSVFTREAARLLSDDEYKRLQSVLMLRPEAGTIIRGSGGLRKIRWGDVGKGKRGSMRIVYYFDPPDTIYMLFPYKKTAQDDLTSRQIKVLRKLVQEWLS